MTAVARRAHMLMEHRLTFAVLQVLLNSPAAGATGATGGLSEATAAWHLIVGELRYQGNGISLEPCLRMAVPTARGTAFVPRTGSRQLVNRCSPLSHPANKGLSPSIRDLAAWEPWSQATDRRTSSSSAQSAGAESV